MAFDWTTVAVAVVSASAGVTGGIYGARSARSTARDQMRNDREIRREEREQTRKDSAYMTIARYHIRMLARAEKTPPIDPEHVVWDLKPGPVDPEEIVDITALENNYGSEKINELASVVSEKLRAFQWHADHVKFVAGVVVHEPGKEPYVPGAAEETADFLEARRELVGAISNVLDRIAEELSHPQLDDVPGRNLPHSGPDRHVRESDAHLTQPVLSK